MSGGLVVCFNTRKQLARHPHRSWQWLTTTKNGNVFIDHNWDESSKKELRCQDPSYIWMFHFIAEEEKKK